MSSRTIFSLATPAGKSGVAVVRLSGGEAKAIAEKICGPIHEARRAYFRTLRAEDGSELDQALVLWFQGPASFTGEDVVEFQVHGGRAIINGVLARLAGLGASPAVAGEFTRRALENGKLDTLQVEALADFINADTEAQRKLSFRNLKGEAGEWTLALREKLVEAMSLVTASIDFSDEDLPTSLVSSIGESIDNVILALEIEIGKTSRASSLRDGYRVAILGKPNVGKSSLINALAGREVAIATEIAGTTRDVLEVFIDINGLPIILYDTAGLRETEDVVESIGVDRARKTAKDADLRLFLYENIEELDDLGVDVVEGDLVYQAKSDVYGAKAAAISAKTGSGIGELLAELAQTFSDQTLEAGFFGTQRQIAALGNALSSLQDAKSFYDQGESVYELLAESLRQAVHALDVLVGRVDVEDMLDVIFSKFCIGK